MPTKNETEGTAGPIGAEIRRLRTEKGWTLRQLGEAAALDWSYLAKIERGASAHPDTYRDIAGALGLTLSQLYAVLDRRPPRRATSRPATV